MIPSYHCRYSPFTILFRAWQGAASIWTTSSGSSCSRSLIHTQKASICSRGPSTYTSVYPSISPDESEDTVYSNSSTLKPSVMAASPRTVTISGGMGSYYFTWTPMRLSELAWSRKVSAPLVSAYFKHITGDYIQQRWLDWSLLAAYRASDRLTVHGMCVVWISVDGGVVWASHEARSAEPSIRNILDSAYLPRGKDWHSTICKWKTGRRVEIGTRCVRDWGSQCEAMPYYCKRLKSQFSA